MCRPLAWADGPDEQGNGQDGETWKCSQIQRRTRDDAYARGEDSRSWFQQQPALSLQMLAEAGVSAGDSLIDVGGGASPLAGALLSQGFTDVTVLDVSATGMRYAQGHLGGRATRVRWLVADVLTWQPERRTCGVPELGHRS